MATYTHDIEIKIDGISIEGEIGFDNGNEASFKTNTGEEMTLRQHAQIQDLLESFAKTASRCGDIEKLEIVKK